MNNFLKLIDIILSMKLEFYLIATIILALFFSTLLISINAVPLNPNGSSKVINAGSLCSAPTKSGVNVNGVLFNETDLSGGQILSGNANCNVLLNSGNSNLSIYGSLNVSGVLMIEGDYVNISGNINATKIIVVSSDCMTFNGNIKSLVYTQFVGENEQNTNCTSFFNGSIIVNTTVNPLLTLNGNNYSILFNFSGPLYFNGAGVSSNSTLAATAPQITINNSNFLLASNLDSVFYSQSPVISAGGSQTTANYTPCVYSPDSSSASTCIPIYLYGNMNLGAMPITDGSLFVNGVFNSSNNSIIQWPSGLVQTYDNVINNNVLNVSVYVPNVGLTPTAYIGIQFSNSSIFDCTSSVCVQYYIPVITK